MSVETIWKQGHFILIEQEDNFGEVYWTIVNQFDGTHTHVKDRGRGNIDVAILIANKAERGVMKKGYPYFIKLSIFRVMDATAQKFHLNKMEPKDRKKYEKEIYDDETYKNSRRQPYIRMPFRILQRQRKSNRRSPSDI